LGRADEAGSKRIDGPAGWEVGPEAGQVEKERERIWGEGLERFCFF
jgi:hypothetical protein